MKRLLLLLLAATACIQRPSLRDIDDLAEQGKFVFVGTVVDPKGGPDGHALVKVEDVITGRELLGDFAGRNIAVALREPRPLQHALFFTNVTSWGRSITAEEVGHRGARGWTPEELRARIEDAGAQTRDRHVQERLAKAALVVAGRVVDVRPADVRRWPSEHDPDWQIATVAVTDVLKGNAEQQLEVLFPGSEDEMWIDAPHFRPGDEGVWLLQRNQEEKGIVRMRARGLTALDALDFRRLSELPRLRQLAGSRSGDKP